MLLTESRFSVPERTRKEAGPESLVRANKGCLSCVESMTQLDRRADYPDTLETEGGYVCVLGGLATSRKHFHSRRCHAPKQQIWPAPSVPKPEKVLRNCCEIAFCSRHTRAEPTGLEPEKLPSTLFTCLRAVYPDCVVRKCAEPYVPGTIIVLIWSIELSSAVSAALISIASRPMERSVPGGKPSFPPRASCISSESSAAR